MQAEVALGLDVQAQGRYRAGDIDAAQRIDHRDLAQRVDHRAQQIEVHRGAFHQRHHVGVQRAAEGIGGPAVLQLEHAHFGHVRAPRSLDRSVVDIQVAGLEDLHLAVGPRTDDGAVHHHRVPHVHQHRRVVDDIDLRVGARIDARRVHAAGVGRVDIDRAARGVQIRDVDIEGVEGIQVTALAVHHLQALQLLLQGRDIGLVARHRLRVRSVFGLHLGQLADLFADDVLLAGVAQHRLAQVHRLEHVIDAAHLVGREFAEVPGQRAVLVVLRQRGRILLPVAVAVVLRRQIQVAAVQAVVVVVIVALLDDHAGRDIDLDVLRPEGREFIAHVDVHRAVGAVQAGRARSQQLLQDGAHDGRVGVEGHRIVGLRRQRQARQIQGIDQRGGNDEDIGRIVHTGDDARGRRGGHQAGALVDHAGGQVHGGVQVQADDLHRSVHIGLVQRGRIGLQAHIALRLEQRSVAAGAVDHDAVDLARARAAVDQRDLRHAHHGEGHIVIGQQIAGGQGIRHLAAAGEHHDIVALDGRIIDLDAVAHRQVIIAVGLAGAGDRDHQHIADGRGDAARIGRQRHIAEGIAHEGPVDLDLGQRAVGAQMIGRQRDGEARHAGDLVALGIDDVIGDDHVQHARGVVIPLGHDHRHAGRVYRVGGRARSADLDDGLRLDRDVLLADVHAGHLDRIGAERRIAAHRVVGADIDLVADDLRTAADADISGAAQVHVDLAPAARHQGDGARVHADVGGLRLAGRNRHQRPFDISAVADLHPRVQAGAQRGAVGRHGDAAHFQRTRLGQQACLAVAVGMRLRGDADDVAAQAGIVDHRLERAAQAGLGAHHAHADHAAGDGLGIGAAIVGAFGVDIDQAGRGACGRGRAHAIQDRAVARLGQGRGADIHQRPVHIDRQARGGGHARRLGAAEVHRHPRIDVHHRGRHGGLRHRGRGRIARDVLGDAHAHRRADRADGHADLGQVDLGQHIGVRRHRHRAQGAHLAIAADPRADRVARIVAHAHAGAGAGHARIGGHRGGHRLQALELRLLQRQHRQIVVGADLLAAGRADIGIDRVLGHRIDQRHDQGHTGARRQAQRGRHAIGGRAGDEAVVLGANGQRTSAAAHADRDHGAVDIGRGPGGEAIADLHARGGRRHAGADHGQGPGEVHAVQGGAGGGQHVEIARIHRKGAIGDIGLRAMVARHAVARIAAEGVAGDGYAHGGAQARARDAGRHRAGHGIDAGGIVGRDRHAGAGGERGARHMAVHRIGHRLAAARAGAAHGHARQRHGRRGGHRGAVQRRCLLGRHGQRIRHRNRRAAHARLHAGGRDIADIGGAHRHRTAADRQGQRGAHRLGHQVAAVLGAHAQARHLRARGRRQHAVVDIGLHAAQGLVARQRRAHRQGQARAGTGGARAHRGRPQGRGIGGRHRQALGGPHIGVGLGQPVHIGAGLGLGGIERGRARAGQRHALQGHGHRARAHLGLQPLHAVGRDRDRAQPGHLALRQAGARAGAVADLVFRQGGADGQGSPGRREAQAGDHHGRLDRALHVGVYGQRIAAIAADARAIDQGRRRRADEVAGIGAAAGQRDPAQAHAHADGDRHRHGGDAGLAVGLDRDGRRADKAHPVDGGQSGIADLVLGQRGGHRQRGGRAQRHRHRDGHRRDGAVDLGLVQGIDRDAARLERRLPALVADARRDAGLYLVHGARARARAGDRQAGAVDDGRRIGHRHRDRAGHHDRVDALLPVHLAVGLEADVARVHRDRAGRDGAAVDQRHDLVDRAARAQPHDLAGAVDVVADHVLGHGHADRGRGGRVVADRYRGRHAEHHGVDARQAQRQHIQIAGGARAAGVDAGAADAGLHAGGNHIARQRAAAADGGIGARAHRHRHRGAQHHRQDIGLLRGADRQAAAAGDDAAARDRGLDRIEYLVDGHAGADRDGHAGRAGLHRDRAAHRDGGDSGVIGCAYRHRPARSAQLGVLDPRPDHGGDIADGHRHADGCAGAHAAGRDRHAQGAGHGHDAAAVLGVDADRAAVARRAFHARQARLDRAVYGIAAAGAGAGARETLPHRHRRGHAYGGRHNPRGVGRLHGHAGLRAHRGRTGGIAAAGAVDIGQGVVAYPVVGRRNAGRDARAAAWRYRHAQAAGHRQHIALVAGLHGHARLSAADGQRFDQAGIADAGLVAAVDAIDGHRAAHRHRHRAHGHAAGHGEIMDAAREDGTHLHMPAPHRAFGIADLRGDAMRARHAQGRASHIVVR